MKILLIYFRIFWSLWHFLQSLNANVQKSLKYTARKGDIYLIQSQEIRKGFGSKANERKGFIIKKVCWRLFLIETLHPTDWRYFMARSLSAEDYTLHNVIYCSHTCAVHVQLKIPCLLRSYAKLNVVSMSYCNAKIKKQSWNFFILSLRKYTFSKTV